MENVGDYDGLPEDQSGSDVQPSPSFSSSILPHKETAITLVKKAASLFLSSENDDEVVMLCHKAIEHDRYCKPAYFLLARRSMAMDQPAEALGYLKVAINIKPDNVGDVLGFCKKALQVYPGYKELYQFFAGENLIRGKIKEALVCMIAAISADENFSEDVLDLCAKALKESPECTDAYRLLAKYACEIEKNDDKALEHIGKAHSLSPYDSRILAEEAGLLWKKRTDALMNEDYHGEFVYQKEAFNAIDQAIEFSSNSIEFRVEKVKFLISIRRFDTALELLKQTREQCADILPEEKAILHVHCGHVYLHKVMTEVSSGDDIRVLTEEHKSNLRTARICYDNAIQCCPGYADAYHFKGAMEHNLGNSEASKLAKSIHILLSGNKPVSLLWVLVEETPEPEMVLRASCLVLNQFPLDRKALEMLGSTDAYEHQHYYGWRALSIRPLYEPAVALIEKLNLQARPTNPPLLQELCLRAVHTSEELKKQLNEQSVNMDTVLSSASWTTTQQPTGWVRRVTLEEKNKEVSGAEL